MNQTKIKKLQHTFESNTLHKYNSFSHFFLDFFNLSSHYVTQTTKTHTKYNKN